MWLFLLMGLGVIVFAGLVAFIEPKLPPRSK